MAVEYHQGLRKALSDPAVAAAFAGQSRPFARVEWFAALEEVCGLEGVYASSGGAVLPLMRAPGGFAGLANWYAFTWQPIGTPDPAGVEAIARDLARRCWRVTLDQVPDEDGTASLVADAFARAGWRVLRKAADVNHFLRPGGREWATCLAARPGQLRSTLKRKSGQVETHISTVFQDSDWDIYQTIYENSWKPEEGVPAFLRRFAREEAAAGRMRLGLAYVDATPVAAQFWTVEDGVAYIHKLAHREDAKAASPGSVLSAALFEHVIDRDGVREIDFGTGDTPYKRDWMEEARPRFRLDLIRPENPRSWPILARAAVKRLVGGSGRG